MGVNRSISTLHSPPHHKVREEADVKDGLQKHDAEEVLLLLAVGDGVREQEHDGACDDVIHPSRGIVGPRQVDSLVVILLLLAHNLLAVLLVGGDDDTLALLEGFPSSRPQPLARFVGFGYFIRARFLFATVW